MEQASTSSSVSADRHTVMPRPLRNRPTLLWWLSPLRYGPDSDSQQFWVVTSLVSGWLFTTVVVDIALHWSVFIESPLELVATIIGALLAMIFCVSPLIMRQQFPRWCGVLGYFAALVLLGHNIFYVGDAVLATTALHILPVLGMYLGWFWEFRRSSIIFSFSLAIIFSATYFSPLVGPGRLLTYMVAVFTVFLMAIAFAMSAYLSQNLTAAASTDGLTGALNVRGSRARLAIEIARARRRREPLTIAVTDFDRFKQVNDTQGHTYGDEVLRNTVRGWLRNLRIYDVVGRLGGDEFVLIFPRTDARDADVVLQRLERESSHSWTFGLAELASNDTLESILSRADERLYEKKRSSSAMNVEREPGPATAVVTHPEILRAQRVRQTPFSAMSATMGLIVAVPIIVGFMVGELGPVAETTVTLWGALATGILVTLISLLAGEKLSINATLWLAVPVLMVYIVFAIEVDHIMRGVGIVYALSAFALYLGTFAGSHTARLLVLCGLIAVTVPLVIQAFSGGNETEKAVVVTTVIYAFSVCFVLFELSSYLYNRSRMLVEHDALTGALNRYGLSEYGNAEIARAERGEYPLSAVMLDCIGFKHINDTLGHPAGDKLLADLVSHLAMGLAPDDILVRFGGDEFLILVPYMDADRTREHVDTVLTGAPINMWVGIAELEPGETLEELIARADRQLFAS